MTSLEFKAGDLVMYSDGPTALVRLATPHAGGWHGDHCLGGFRFVSPPDMRHATPEEIERAKQSRFYVL